MSNINRNKKTGVIDIKMLATETGDSVAITVTAMDGVPLCHQQLEDLIIAYFDHLREYAVNESDYN